MNNITEWLIFVAIFLSNSKRYAKAKKIAYNLLENEHSPYRRYVDGFLIIAVFASVGLYLYDIRNDLSPLLQCIATLFTVIFIIEYALRLWLCSDGSRDILKLISKKNEMGITPSVVEILNAPLKNKLIWMSNPMSIIDLISIFPQFRIVRIFKLFRYSDGSRNLLSVFQEKRQELLILIILIIVALFMASALFYFFEQANDNVNTFFDAIYWAVITITTVGYGDISPITTQGRALAIFLVFSGIGVIAMLTSIVTAGLTQKLLEIKERKNMDSLEKAKHYVIIIGFSRLSQDLCKILSEQKKSFVVVDKNEEAVKKAWQLNYRAILADVSEQDILRDTLNTRQKATTVACLTSSDITNISIALAVKSLGAQATIIARCTEPKNRSKMELAGINMVVDYYFGAIILAHCINKPVIYQTISNMVFSLSSNVAIDEIKVHNKDDVDLIFLDTDCIVLGVFRDNGEFFFNPSNVEFVLQNNDIIVVVGRPLRIEGIKLELAQKKGVMWR